MLYYGELVIKHKPNTMNNSIPGHALFPMTVTDVMNRTFRVYRDNLIAFLSLVTVIIVPLTIISTSIGASMQDELNAMDRANPELPEGFWLVILVAFVSAFLQGVVINGLITYMVSERVLGRSTSIGEALSAVQSRLVPLALGMFILLVSIFVATLLLLVTGAICLFPLIGLPMLFYLAIAANFYLAPVLVLENVLPSVGIQRALKLGKARFWQTLQLVIGIAIVLFILQFFLGLVTAAITGVEAGSVEAVNSGAYLTLDVIITILITPVMPIALTLMYYDTRVRVEQLDEALQEVNKPDARPSDVASPAPDGTLLEREDLTNILLLTIGGITILVLLTPLIGAILQVFFGV